jgi:hypothetical protein
MCIFDHSHVWSTFAGYCCVDLSTAPASGEMTRLLFSFNILLVGVLKSNCFIYILYSFFILLRTKISYRFPCVGILIRRR